MTGDTKMLYGGFLDNLQRAFDERVQHVASKKNIDLGHEWESVLCDVLQSALPEKYGVCRGYAVTPDGKSAGDDVLVYDRLRFPSLRALEGAHVLDHVPIEAIYCYIEAKHTIHLEGEGGQSLAKANRQVGAVKRLKRPTVPLEQINPHTSLVREVHMPVWPAKQNPMLGMVWARYVQGRARGPQLSAQQIGEWFEFNQPALHYPAADLMVLGSSVLVYPRSNSACLTPFFVDGASKFGVAHSPGSAPAAALCHLIGALDFIELGALPLQDIVEHANSTPSGR